MTTSSGPSLAAGPHRCTTDELAFQLGTYARGNQVNVLLRDRGRTACTVARLPSLQLAVSDEVVSVLRASRYAPAHRGVIRPGHPARIMVRLASGTCHAGKAQMQLALGSFTYGFSLDGAPCLMSITSARVVGG